MAGSKGGSRVIRTKALIQRVKERIIKQKSSVRRLAKELKTSHGTIHRIIKEDLDYKAYKKRVSPKMIDEHCSKRRALDTWVRKNMTKSGSEKTLFSDEKHFHVNPPLNKQNERIYAATREEAGDAGGVYRKTQFSPGAMVWLGVCSEGVTRPVIIGDGSIDSERYINKILSVTLEDGQKNGRCRLHFSARQRTTSSTQKYARLV